MRFPLGSSVRTLPPYSAHWHPFSMLLSKKETSRCCGNPPMCLLCQNRHLPWTLILHGFRPISLTPIVSKILESFPHNWLLRSVSGQIDNLQFVALRRLSSTMALLYMFHKWYEAMGTPSTCLRVCTLDFSKAFDRIDFNILLQELINMGIPPVIINWIANFLTDRRQRTRIGPNYSC